MSLKKQKKPQRDIQYISDIPLRLIANPKNAPCSVILEAVLSNAAKRAIKNEMGEEGLKKGEKLNVLFSTDWDWPALAELFGWCPAHLTSKKNPMCEHSGTDGTVNCGNCECKASDFIYHARQWLDDHDGEICDNPGYELEVQT